MFKTDELSCYLNDFRVRENWIQVKQGMCDVMRSSQRTPRLSHFTHVQLPIPQNQINTQDHLTSDGV